MLRTMSIKIVCLFLISVPTLTFAQNNLLSEDENKFYSSRYDNIDVEVIFKSSRLLNNYVDCLLDKKPCPPEGKDLKRVLPHALRTKCARCTRIQKAKALDVITRLYYQYPAMYLDLADRYDPTGEFTKNFENWFDEQQRDKSQSNEVPQRLNRIPSTWITPPSTTPRTTTTTTTSRPTLRTLPSTVRIKIIPTDRPSVTPRPINANKPTNVQKFSQPATLRPLSTTTVVVYPLERRVQDVRPNVRDQNQSPLASSSFRPFQQFVPESVDTSPRISTVADQTFRNSPERPVIRTFPAPADAAVRTVSATSSPAPLPGSSAAAVTTARPPLPSSPTTSRAPSTTPRPVLATTNAAASPRNPPPARDSTSTTVLPTVQSTPRPPLSNPPLPDVNVPSVPVPADAVQSVPPRDFIQPPAAAPAPPFFNFVPQQPVPVTFRTPVIQRPALSLNDPNLIDNFFVPRTGPFRRSINQFFDTTGQAVNNAFWTFFNG